MRIATSSTKQKSFDTSRPATTPRALSELVTSKPSERIAASARSG